VEYTGLNQYQYQYTGTVTINSTGIGSGMSEVSDGFKKGGLGGGFKASFGQGMKMIGSVHGGFADSFEALQAKSHGALAFKRVGWWDKIQYQLEESDIINILESQSDYVLWGTLFSYFMRLDEKSQYGRGRYHREKENLINRHQLFYGKVYKRQREWKKSRCDTHADKLMVRSWRKLEERMKREEERREEKVMKKAWERTERKRERDQRRAFERAERERKAREGGNVQGNGNAGPGAGPGNSNGPFRGKDLSINTGAYGSNTNSQSIGVSVPSTSVSNPAADQAPPQGIIILRPSGLINLIFSFTKSQNSKI
jgi:hypothetical protein